MKFTVLQEKRFKKLLESKDTAWRVTEKERERNAHYGKYKKIKTIKKAGTVRFTDKKLKKGFAYYYKVRAYRKTAVAKVYGNDSAAKKVKIK